MDDREPSFSSTAESATMVLGREEIIKKKKKTDKKQMNIMREEDLSVKPAIQREVRGKLHTYCGKM